jgi:O-antigen ligase
MQRFLAKHTSWLVFGVSILLILAMLCSKLLLSMTMFGLVLLGVLNRIYGFGKTIPSFFTQRDVLAPVVLVVFVIITGIWATHLGDWWHEVRQIIPVLGLPIVLYWLPPMTERQYKGIYAALAVLCAIAAISTLYTYYASPHYYAILLQQGRAIEPHLLGIKPIDHIRFSLLAALGSVAGFYLFWTRFEGNFRFLWLLVAFILLASLHILAVRSGLLAFYLCAFSAGLRQIFIQKSYKTAFFVLFLLCAMPFVALRLSPSLQAKYTYTYWEVSQFLKTNTVGENSDAGRLASIFVGIKIGNENPLLGVGFGDVDSKTTYYYAKHFPTAQKILLPHNQWAYQYAAGGILGVLSLSIALFLPLFYQRRYTDFLFLMFSIVAFSSFLSESTLSTALGVALFSFFSALAVNYLRKY